MTRDLDSAIRAVFEALDDHLAADQEYSSPAEMFLHDSTARSDENEPGRPGSLGALGDQHRRLDPEIVLINAYRVYRARRALVEQGTVPVNDIAAAHRCHPSTARRRIQRACDRNELFTVRVSGRIHVPAVLLDDACHARSEWQPVLAALTESRMSDWAKWGWIAGPNAGLSGEIAAEVIETNPQRVHSAARRKVIQQTS